MWTLPGVADHAAWRFAKMSWNEYLRYFELFISLLTDKSVGTM
jgi:hypothetical protein